MRVARGGRARAASRGGRGEGPTSDVMTPMKTLAGLHEDRFVLRLEDDDLAEAKRLGAKDFESIARGTGPRPSLGSRAAGRGMRPARRGGRTSPPSAAPAGRKRRTPCARS